LRQRREGSGKQIESSGKIIVSGFKCMEVKPRASKRIADSRKVIMNFFICSKKLGIILVPSIMTRKLGIIVVPSIMTRKLGIIVVPSIGLGVLR
jgi:hypothetical protein